MTRSFGFSSEYELRTQREGEGIGPPLQLFLRVYDEAMQRPKPYREFRFIGDKRTQKVYDLDTDYPEDVIEALVASEKVATFGPDTLAEARNRGYRPA